MTQRIQESTCARKEFAVVSTWAVLFPRERATRRRVWSSLAFVVLCAAALHSVSGQVADPRAKPARSRSSRGRAVDRPKPRPVLTADDYLAQAEELLDRDRYKESITAAKRAVALDPGLADAYDVMARAAYALKNFDLAVSSCEDALESVEGQDVPLCLHDYRPMRRLQGEWALGARFLSFRPLRQAVYRDAVVHELAAALYLDAGLPVEALAEARRVLSVGKFPTAYVETAIDYGRTADAAQLIRESLGRTDLDESSAIDRLTQAALLQLAAGEIESAATLFHSAWKYSGSGSSSSRFRTSQAGWRYAYLCAKLRRTDEARIALETLEQTSTYVIEGQSRAGRGSGLARASVDRCPRG